MKSLLKLCVVALAAAFCGVGCAAAASCIKYNKVESADTISEYISENRPVSGMFFSAEYVVEEYEYDDAFCLLYNDPDANMCKSVLTSKLTKLCKKLSKKNMKWSVALC